MFFQIIATYENSLLMIAIANQGFSLGIDDVQPGERLSKEKELTVEKGYADCDDTIRLSKEGRLQNLPGSNQEQTLEVRASV